MENFAISGNGPVKGNLEAGNGSFFFDQLARGKSRVINIASGRRSGVAPLAVVANFDFPAIRGAINLVSEAFFFAIVGILNKDVVTGIVSKLEVGTGNKDGGIVPRRRVFFIVANTEGVRPTLGNVEAGIKHSAEESGGDLTDAATNIKLGATLTNDIGFFVTGFESNLTEIF